MQYLKTLLTIFFLGSFTGSWAQADAEAQQLLDAAIAEKQFIGVAAGIAVGDEIVWKSGAGFADLEKKTPFSTTTLTRPASIAKPMTAIAVLQLYERGQLDLDLPIQTYIPDFPRKTAGDITVRHLLTHTSGIRGYASVKEAETTTNYPTLADAVKSFQDRDLLGKPGQVFEYTTYGYTVLGLIIERVSGLSYGEFLQKNICQPAGMDHTGVEIYGTDYPGKASLYHNHGKGKIKPGKANNLSNRIPGGGLYATVTDLLKFGQAVLDHRLVKASTLEMMLTDPGIRQGGNPYSMGWFLYGMNPKYGNVIGHSGEQTGASGQLMLLPEVNTAIVVLANTSGAWREAFQLSVRLFDIAAEAQPKPAKSAFDLSLLPGQWTLQCFIKFDSPGTLECGRPKPDSGEAFTYDPTTGMGQRKVTKGPLGDEAVDFKITVQGEKTYIAYSLADGREMTGEIVQLDDKKLKIRLEEEGCFTVQNRVR